jgi:hypothetical protein
MTPDPRWLLEILKARGWQTAAVSIGCALLLWANRAGWLPPFEPWMVQLGAVAMVICGLLALASLVSNATIQIKKWSTSVREWLDLRHSIKTLNTDEIAFLKGQVKKARQQRSYTPSMLAVSQILFIGRACTKACTTTRSYTSARLIRRVKSRRLGSDRRPGC